jgi:8-amino-7-oxononanoate synthase
MADPLEWVAPALDDLEAAGLRRRLRHRAGPTGRTVDGLVNLSSNDYLGLAAHPRVAAAAADATRLWGAGSGASRLVTGSTALHRELEAALASWKRTEDAIVFSSGYLANTGTIAALAGPGDLICSDALNHASIVDGCRLSRAEVGVYPHGDVAALERLLVAGRNARRRLVVTDGIFSMDGDAADVATICDLAADHDAMVMVDDAHGCGVVGPDGRGIAAAQGCAVRVSAAMGTLSKAFGAAGGYVAGSADLCDWLRNRARGFVFDTAPPPASVGAALESLELCREEPWRRAQARDLARRLAGALGLPEPAACIVPLVIGEARAAVGISAALERDGMLAMAIRPPSVPPGTARLRLTVTASHTLGDVESAAAALALALPASAGPPAVRAGAGSDTGDRFGTQQRVERRGS